MKKVIVIAALLIGLNFAANAQPGSGGFGDEPQDVPLDGGILLLAAAVVSYGCKKLKFNYHHKK